MRRAAAIRRIVFLLLSAVALAAIHIAGQTPQTAPPIFPSGVDLVTVDAVVVDQQGRPVQGLTQQDFTVKENGERQKIAAFEAVALAESASSPQRLQRVSTNTAPPFESTGRWFFIVFDDVNMSQYSTPRARDTIVPFIERTLRDGDQVMIAAASGGAWLRGRMPEDRQRLVAFVGRLEGARRPDTTAARIWDHEAMGIALGRDPQALAQVARRYFENNLIPEPISAEARAAVDVSPGIALIQASAKQVYNEAIQRLRTSLGTLERISASLAQARGRKTVLLFSEGFIMDPAQPDFRALVQAARSANAAIYFVDVNDPQGMVGKPGLPGANAESGAAVEERDTTTALAFAAREQDGARSVALNTGGRTISGTNLVSGLARVSAEARSYYLLGYTPANNKRDGGFRKIEVVVNRPGVEVIARGGYYAPSAGPKPRPSSDELDRNVRAALDSPFDAPGIPLRLTSYVFGAQGDGTIQTVLVAEADPAPLRFHLNAGNSTDTLDSYLIVQNADNGGIQRDEHLIELSMPRPVLDEARRAGVPIRREFSLMPGRYQAALIVRERATGLLGSVRHAFEVPKIGEFRVSTPIVSDVFQTTSSGRPTPVAIARRSFRVSTRVGCAFEIYGAARNAVDGMAHVTLAYSLRNAEGREVTTSPPRPLNSNAQGQVSVVLALTLPLTGVGDHTLHVTVHDELANRSIDLEEPIIITN